MSDNFCCKQLKEHTYYFDYHKEDKEWSILGCGGCYVLQGVKFCPFCGKNITNPPYNQK